MYTRPMIFPLTPDGSLYMLQDQLGNHIGNGSREACETLRYLLMSSPLMKTPTPSGNKIAPRPAAPAGAVK